MTEKKGKKPSILVTGGAGFIGSSLVTTLLDEGANVVVVDNFITGRRENIAPFLARPGFDFKEIDITTSAFQTALKDTHFDEIYHLACPTGVPNIYKLGREMWRACVIGTEAVADIAVETGARMLLASSAEIYGSPSVFPQSEEYLGNTDPKGPRSPYEQGKRLAEGIVAHFVSQNGLHATIARIFNTYGPNMSPTDQRVIPQFLQAVLHDGEIVVYGTGEQTRSHIYIDDLLSGLKLIMERGIAGEAYNVGGGTEVSINELATTIKRLAARENNITHRPHFIKDNERRCPAIGKIMSLGDWQPKVVLEEGLASMMQEWGVKVAT